MNLTEYLDSPFREALISEKERVSMLLWKRMFECVLACLKRRLPNTSSQKLAKLLVAGAAHGVKPITRGDFTTEDLDTALEEIEAFVARARCLFTLDGTIDTSTFAMDVITRLDLEALRYLKDLVE